jgi:hypothetical protein
MFLWANADERLTTLDTRRVVRSLVVPNQKQFWEDMTRVRQLLLSGLPVRPEDQLVPGATVVIRSGVLAGLRGVILRTANGHRFVVQDDFIQRGATVLLNDYMLAAVAPDTAEGALS